MTKFLQWTSAQTPVAIALTLTLTVVWLLTHRYQGLSQDARIYAVQALARINPALESDLYLQNTSQDRYTLFSPLYAQFISLLGLQDAARILTLLFEAGFLVASWNLARALVGREKAWLAVGSLILTVGAYGSYGVFRFAEDYLTARSAAEALIATALAIHFGGFRRLALVVALSALMIHPLIALPGVLLLIFLTVSTRMATLLALAGIALAVAGALTASTLPWFRLFFPTMDAVWLHIVTERSQFLFLQFWSFRDGEVNLRPFASLALTSLILADRQIRKLCVSAAIVGVSGLLVALMAGTIGPVALLVQGQAWRWVWIAVFISVVLMIPTALRLWQDEKCGPLCAVLLVASWTVSAGIAPALALVALALFLLRAHIGRVTDTYVRFAALILAAAFICWDMGNAVTAKPSAFGAGIYASTKTVFLQGTENIAALRFPVAILLLLVWQLLRSSKNHWLPISWSIALGAACAFLVPIAFAKTDTVGSIPEILEFADWRRAIPPSANVYVANGHDAASFAWFTLQRPNYLSLDQSAGVVFSRATAFEVQRRAEVLLPLMSEDWKLLSKNRAANSVSKNLLLRRTPLTARTLINLCQDSQLGFLIAREDVGFNPQRHRHSGLWMDWNLYDCGHVRTFGPAI